MKPDLYTKAVLTFIAIALLLNALSPVLHPTIVRAKTADPLEDIASELKYMRSSIDDIKSYGLRVRGVNSTEVRVKLDD